ncbi:MAG TPA: hypothetical protein VHV77_04730, partial [Pirellulales bacterium]|nr:hypothetical protein [Pirellulales bacterium]
MMLESELAGRWVAADEYRSQVLKALAVATPEHPAWAALWRRVFGGTQSPPVADAAELYHRVMCELLIDTQVALINGRLTSDTWPAADDRANALLDGLCEIVCTAKLDDTLATWRCELQLTGLRRFDGAAKWNEAIGFAQQLVFQSRDFEPFQEQLFYTLLRAGLAEAGSPKTESDSLTAAHALLKRIEQGEAIRAQYPYCYEAYEVLAILQTSRAVCLANGDRPAQALVAAEEALAYRPGWEDALKARQRIEPLLRQLQERMESVRSQLGSRWENGQLRTMTLNLEGQLLANEANRGTSLRDEFIGSQQRRDRLEQWQVARNRKLWRRIGLEVPESGWDERAAALDRATDLLLQKKPTNAVELFAGWQEVADEYPELRIETFDAMKVLEFFARGGRAAEAPAPPPAGDPPVLAEPATASRSGNHLPFETWMFSNRDMKLKAMVAAAAAMVCLAAWSTVSTRRTLQAREAAYDRFVEAAERLDDAEAREAGEAFLATIPNNYYSTRQQQVERTLEESERWPAQRLRNTAVKELATAIDAHNDEAVMAAAAKFLEARDPQSTDPREKVVIDRYSEAFVRYFASHDLDDAVRASADRFRKHLQLAAVSGSQP